MAKKTVYHKTKYPNIFWYETTKGKRYHIRRGYKLDGKKKEATKSNLKSLSEARAALAEIERKIDNNEFAYNKNLTVDQYWNIYSELQIKRGIWAPDTERVKTITYKTHIADWLGNTKLSKVSRMAYEERINQMLETHRTTTVKGLHMVFNAMMNHAFNNKIIDDNPVDKIYIGKSELEPQNKRISLEEFKKWDATAEKLLDQFQYLAVRLTYLGLRKSEVLGIKLGNLTRQEDGRYLVKLDESRTYMRPRGGRMKTKSSERCLVADEKTSRLIDKAIPKAHRIANVSGRILSSDDFFFVAGYKAVHKSNYGKPWPTSRLNTIFRAVSTDCGVHASPHTMRHFFATQGQIAGIPIEHMAAALGHTTTYMTQKYTHIKEEVSKSVTDSFISALQ